MEQLLQKMNGLTSWNISRLCAVLRAVVLGLTIVTIPPGMASDTPPNPANGDSQTSLSWKWALNWYNGGSQTGLRDSIPAWEGFSDLRPSASLAVGESVEAVIKLRARVGVSDVQKTSQPDTWSTSSLLDLNQGYVNWRITEDAQLSLGRMYLQWGPAELLNPSNGIFQVTLDQRSNLWVAQGKDLFKLSYTPGKNWSAVLFGEMLNAASFASSNSNTADLPFERKIQAKMEYMNDDSTRYIGLGSGTSQLGRFWLGEYGSLGLAEGWSLYADLRQMRGSSSYYPVMTSTGTVTLAQSRLDDPRYYNLAVGGIRFEDRVDVRVEYIRNDEAYSSAERQLAALAVSDPVSLKRYLFPGFQLPGQDFLYLSLRVPDIGPKKAMTAFGQYLRSLTDGSSALFANGIWNFSDRATAFLELGFFLGGTHSELGQAIGSQFTLGTRMTW